MPHFTNVIDVVQSEDEFEDVFPREIRTDRLLLKPLTEAVSPTEAWQVYSEYPSTDKYFNTTTGIPETYQDTIDMFEMVRELRESGDDFFYAMIDRESGEFLGNATIEDVDFHAGRCGIGIWLRKDKWGNGYSQERAEALLYMIFEELPISTVEIRVATENTKSIKAVLKYMRAFGGSFEGKLRNKSITPPREVVDIYVWSITESEFFGDSQYTEDILTPTSKLDSIRAETV